ncbi:MAG TPA: deoxyhypusine synthase [Alphaproteobacteria bacterium]|nr:deoxyhypusine synthase [Alphaproteobacteria bacterium]
MKFENSDYQEHTQHMRKYDSMEGFPEVKGYDFEEKFDYDKFVSSFKNMGLQATHLGMGIDITNQMINDEAKIFLSATSNMISSGNREVIKFLVKNKYVHVLSISAGGIEEDIIKTLKPFVIGSFDISGRALFDKGVGRIGNIFAPFDRYLYFEKFMQPLFDRIYEEQKSRGRPFSVSEFIHEMGREAGKLGNHEDSIIYWAFKNNIPVFCPALTDGSIGDLFHFQKLKHPDYYIDILSDHNKIVNIALNSERTGAIILGGGSSKHYVLNANIFREGLDYAVYITTAQEYDGSDSGGNSQEAMSWAKIKVNAPNIKIRAEASLILPLLVASTFKKKYDSKI